MTTQLDSLITTFAWTLLHSLWQGALLFIVYAISKPMTGSSAKLKYAWATGALTIMMVGFGVTFSYLYGGPLVVSNIPTPDETFIPATVISVSEVSDTGFWTSTAIWINSHVNVLLIGWICGVFIFGVRLTAAWWSSVTIEKKAEAITGLWADRLVQLALEIGVTARVTLAHCRDISAPIVVGVLKPMILLPVGMMGGLTADQIEAVLLHELAHIRRHDYIINLMQSLAEVVFFFNPFVWLLSADIRISREQCCDDIVVRLKSPMVYARALHTLGTLVDVPLPASAGLGAVGHKNELLTRIKRIMEPVQNNDAGKRKLVPALFVILISLGGSWLSVQARFAPPLKKPAADSTLRDTTIKDHKKTVINGTFSYSRRSQTTLDKDGNPHETVVEKFGDDGPEEDVTAFPPPPVAPPFPPPQNEQMLSAVGEFPDIPLIASDTLMPAGAFRKQPDWDAFNRQMTERFEKQFGDFYKKNGAELQKMMADLESQMQTMQETSGMKELAGQSRQRAKEMTWANSGQQDLLMKELAEDNAGSAEEFAQMSEKTRAMRFRFDGLNRSMDGFNHGFSRMDQSFRSMAVFEKVLRSELVKDGYLGKNEPLNTLNIGDDGEIRFNGKWLKDSDKPRYEKLRKDYLDPNQKKHVE